MDINHAFGIGISRDRLMRRTTIDLRKNKEINFMIMIFKYACVCVCIKMSLSVYHSLINRIGGLVWEDACRQTGDHFHHTKLMRCLQHVVVDRHVDSLKGRLHTFFKIV